MEPSRKPRQAINGVSPYRPRLVFFCSKASGRSRRVEGYLSQVLQRRHNHESFEVLKVDVDENAELVERFVVDEVRQISSSSRTSASEGAWLAHAAAATSSSCWRPG